MLKKQLGRLIPYPLIELGRKVIHAGPRTCHVCGNHIRTMLDSGYGFEMLERLQVVGGLRRYADTCPICHSSARERLIWFWLTQEGSSFRFDSDIRIAHFAPEKALSKNLLRAAPDGYAAYDFAPERYRHLRQVDRADLTDLQIESSSVDLLLCNHVLEHVPDIGVALGHLFRILKPGGVAILQVPLALRLEQTIELGMDSSIEDRIRLLGQDDHLRLFTPHDYVAALGEAGFDVEQYNAFDANGQLATRWQLDPFETLHLCRKPLAAH